MKNKLFVLISYTFLLFFIFNIKTNALNKEYTFSYTGNYQKFVASYTGLYKLEVWGASGGRGNPESPGGKGGYSVGYYQLNAGDTLYIYVGGVGKTGVDVAGGYNGGGNAQTGSGGKQAGSGGGATDMRLISGNWNDTKSLESRIIVAGGGGGGGWYYTNNTGNFSGGAGGGLKGSDGSTIYSGNYIGTGGTQTAGGQSAEKGITVAGLGYGGSGLRSSSSAGGGGGGYYGGGGSYCAGGGGGSGYIGGVVGTGTETAQTIAGNQSIPTHDNTGTMKGNTGNGYAKITLNIPVIFTSENLEYNYQDDDFHSYYVTIPSAEYTTNLKTVNVDYIWSQGLGEVTFKNNEIHEVILMDKEGKVDVFQITPNIGKARLKNVTFSGFESEFDPDYFHYNAEVSNDITAISPTIETESGVLYRIKNNNLKVGQNTVEIEAYKDGLESTIYYFNIYRKIEIGAGTESLTFSYTGSYQEFIAPYTGMYKLEVWGAEGGKAYDASLGGKGGYSKGYYYLKKDEKLYIYVGEKGKTATSGSIAGGWNGGGLGKIGTGGKYAGSGGGATDIRLVKGDWNNSESLKSRIIVAGGGGGSGMYHASTTANNTGGAGGGTKGIDGVTSLGSSSYIGTGGSQTASGSGSQTANKGGLGYGGSGTSDASSGGGGGGGYYGGGGAYCGGGGGGSGYIGKVTNCNNDNAITIAGNAKVPTYSGTGEMVGNSGNGYAKISFYNPDNLDIVSFISTSVGNLDPEFNPNVTEYSLTLSAEQNVLKITGETQKGQGLLSGLGTYEVKAGNTKYEVTFTNIDGSITVYTIDVTRLASSSAVLKGFKVNGVLYNIEPDVTTYDIELPTEISKINLELIKLYPGQTVPTNNIYDFTEEDLTKTVFVVAEENLANEAYTFNFHRKRTSELKNLKIKSGGELVENFIGNKKTYTVNMSNDSRTLDIETETWFQNTVVTMTEPRYIGLDDKTVTIKVDLDGTPSTIYTLNINRVAKVDSNESFPINYTGSYQEWTAPYTGTYLLEVWGASGGQGNPASPGGKGGYSKGYYYFEAGDKAYVYVGGAGTLGINAKGGWNGGGNSATGVSGKKAGSGGGATDIRLIKGAWNNSESLKSRIIVAGAGGGGGWFHNNDTENFTGGAGGGLSGLNGYSTRSGNYRGTGATQNSAGTGNVSGSNGGFGYGGHGVKDSSSAGGGGGGYYGGGGSYCAGGGGGSSYIKGLLSCDSDNPVTISGDALMPTHDGTGEMLGNSGNGYAKITAKEVIIGDAFLDNIVINDGDVSLVFEPWTNEYNVTVPKGDIDLKIEAIPKDIKSTIIGTGIIEFAPGETKHEITVMNEGSKKIYTLNITREALDDATPKNITLKTSHDHLCSAPNGLCIYNFAPETTVYNIMVPFQTENITLNANLKSKWQQVIYRLVEGENKMVVTNPTFNLKNGTNTFEVEIISESKTASTIYTYNIVKDENGNNSLNSLKIIDPSTEINFDPYIYEYNITVPSTYDKVSLEYEPANPNSIVKVTGDKNLTSGMNDCYITVTSPNNTSRTYIIHIYKEKSSNTFLSSLEVKNNDTNEVLELTPTFNKTIVEYTVKVDSSVNNIMINATAEEGNLIGDGIYSLNSGKNTFHLTVTSISGDIETYTVNIIKDRSNNSDLLNIEVEGYQLDPEFNKDIKNYTITIPKSITSLKVNVTPEESTTTYTIRGNNNLNNNTNTIVITSIAEDKTYQVYTITVNKETSSNNNLKSIDIIGATLNEEFNKETTSYTIDVDGSVNNIQVTGVPEDASATVKGNGKYALVKGTNTIELIVTNELGESKTYTIIVNKALSNDTSLKSVTNNRGSEVIKNTDSEKNYDYLINVQYEVGTIELNGIATSINATVTGNGSYSLLTGNNDITLRVTAEDKITFKDYTIRVVRDKSANDDLSFIYVHEGGIKPDFYETTILYEAKVPSNTDILHIEVLPEDKNALVDITDGTLNNGIYEVNITDLALNTPKDIDIVVTAENGHIKIYTISIIKESSTTENLSLLNLETDRGELNPIFNSDVLNYTLEVDNEISDITISGEAMDKDITYIDGLGTKNLKVGKNLISVFVISKETNIEKSYQIVVTRKPSSDATLSSLVVKGHNLNPEFSKDNLNYNLTTSLSALEFTAIIPTEKDAQYEVLNNHDFVTGENIVTIKVTAPDGTTKEYLLNVTKNGSKNNNLAKLEVIDYTLMPTFHKGVTFYAVEVANDVNSIVINALAEDPNATITGDGLQKVLTGENYYEVVVTSEVGTKKIYNILITKEASDNNYLASLNVSEGELDPNFNKETLDYELTVPYNIESIDINGSLEDINARTNSFGEYELSIGENNISVIVTSESGLIRTYNIKVIREDIVSAYLTSLEVKDYALDPLFNKEIFEYYLNVDSEVTNLDLTYVLEDKNATIEVTGNDSFVVGMNEIHLNITASDNITKQEYILYVNRAMSTNNYLASITTSEGTLNPIFNPTTLEYIIELPREVETITVGATTEDKSARITSGIGEHNLNIGENIILIKVKSSIGISRTYKLKVIRKPSTNNYLKDLNIKNQNTIIALDPEFNKLVNEYTVNASSEFDFITIRGLLEDETASVSGLGVKEIKQGLNVFEIIVTAEDGSINTYKLNITKEISSNNYLSSLIPSVGTLSPEFNKETLSYTLNLTNEQSELEFSATLEDNKATVSGLEAKNVPEGVSVRNIVVTAEDKTEKTYTITINKETASEARLESLELEHYPFEFEPNTFTYNIKVSKTKDKILASELKAVPKDSEATVNLMGDMELIDGIVNIYVIEVIAKDGYTTQEYTLNITRDSEEYTLRTNKYEIVRNETEDYVIGIQPSTVIQDFKNNFENEPEYLKVYEETTIVDESGLTATAYILKLERNDYVYDTLRIIVRGDLTKDGKVNITDQVKMINYVGRTTTFDRYQMLAGDLTFDGKVNITDQVKIINYVGRTISDLNNKPTG